MAALDHEAKSSWSVIVRANDGQGGVDATRTRILVGDVDEPVCSPTSAGCVRVCELDGLDLRWVALQANGGPAITTYEVHYRAGSDRD